MANHKNSRLEKVTYRTGKIMQSELGVRRLTLTPEEAEIAKTLGYKNGQILPTEVARSVVCKINDAKQQTKRV